MDVVALAQLGFPNAVATLGTACTAEHVQKLFRFTDSVVFSFDGDAAGRRAAGRALEAALPARHRHAHASRFLFLPPEHDPDSYVREHGTEAFEQCVAQAVPLSRQLIEAAREGCDLDTAEGRAKLLANAKPLWAGLARRRAQAPVADRAGPARRPVSGRPRPAVAGVRRAPRASPRGRRAEDWYAAPAAAGRPATGWREPRPATCAARPTRPLAHAAAAQRVVGRSWTPNDHDLLHALPPPHGPLAAGWSVTCTSTAAHALGRARSRPCRTPNGPMSARRLVPCRAPARRRHAVADLRRRVMRRHLAIAALQEEQKRSRRAGRPEPRRVGAAGGERGRPDPRNCRAPRS